MSRGYSKIGDMGTQFKSEYISEKMGLYRVVTEAISFYVCMTIFFLVLLVPLSLVAKNIQKSFSEFLHFCKNQMDGPLCNCNNPDNHERGCALTAIDGNFDQPDFVESRIPVDAYTENKRAKYGGLLGGGKSSDTGKNGIASALSSDSGVGPSSPPSPPAESSEREDSSSSTSSESSDMGYRARPAPSNAENTLTYEGNVKEAHKQLEEMEEMVKKREEKLTLDMQLRKHFGSRIYRRQPYKHELATANLESEDESSIYFKGFDSSSLDLSGNSEHDTSLPDLVDLSEELNRVLK